MNLLTSANKILLYAFDYYVYLIKNVNAQELKYVCMYTLNKCYAKLVLYKYARNVFYFKTC